MKTRVRAFACLLTLAVVSPVFPSSGINARPAPPTTTQQAAAEATATDALRQGRALLKRGQAAPALPLLEAALKAFESAGAERGQAAAHDALGDLYAQQGQEPTALEHYRRAEEHFRAAEARASLIKRTVGISDNEFNADLMLAKIGDTQYRVGQITEAGAAYERMRVQKPDTSPLNAAKKGRGLLGGLSSLGRSVARGDVSASTGTSAVGAISAVQQAFELYHQSIIYATHELGLGRVAYFNQQLDSATKHFQNALDAAAGQLPLIGNLGQTRRFRVAARTSLGDVALQQRRFKDALKFYDDAARGARADSRLDLAWPAQRGAARARLLAVADERDAQKKLKAMDDAVVSYREALQTIETLRQGSLRADEARTTFLATTKDVFDEASSALASMALLTATAPNAPLEGRALAYAAESLRVVEAGRARALLDLLSEAGGGGNLDAGVPADLAQRRRENLARQQEIAQQLTGVSLTGEPPKEPVEQLEAELERLNTEYDSLENQIRLGSPRYAALTAPQPLALADVQRQLLDEGTVLLEYSLGAERSYLWAVTDKTVALYELPARAVVEQQASALREQIVPQSLRRSIVELANSAVRGLGGERGLGVAANSPGANSGAGAFATAAHLLYQSIAAPAAATFAGKRLLVVADGALNYIPFEALVSADGADYAALPYLVKTNEIIYAPSASVVAAVRQQASSAAAANAARGMLVVADPVFDSGDPRARPAPNSNAGGSSNSSSSGGTTDGRGLALGGALADFASSTAGSAPTNANGGGLRLARLNGTRAEAQQIAQLARAAGLSPDVWLDFDADEAKLKAGDMTKYRVLHVATHGLLDTARPQFTGVVLSLVGNRDADGFLRTDEVFGLRLGAPLVMLSACETGLGKEKRGEGVIGLTRAFMYAGAPTVGVSLWSVADRSTAELMSAFYQRLLARPSPATPAAALRAAQRQMIDERKFSAPFYWAPFVLVGDWR